MSNRIRLKDGTEFLLEGYGYVNVEFRKEVQFRFSSDLGIGYVQAVFMDMDAISKIDYLLVDGSTKETITTCAAYQSITQDSEGKYIVTLSTDKVSAEIKRTNDELAAARLELNDTKQQIATANAMINAFADTIVLISAPMI